MSMLEVLLAGKPAQTTGDLSPAARETAQSLARAFAASVRRLAAEQGVSSGPLDEPACNHLFVGCDRLNMHFAFVRSKGRRVVDMRDYTALPALQLQTILQPLREAVGEVVWSFSCPYSNVPPSWTSNYLDGIASQYLGSLTPLPGPAGGPA